MRAMKQLASIQGRNMLRQLWSACELKFPQAGGDHRGDLAWRHKGYSRGRERCTCVGELHREGNLDAAGVVEGAGEGAGRVEQA